MPPPPGPALRPPPGPALPPPRAEWLEADGDGGYASGTVAGYRTRRYHALLLVSATPPTGRIALVNGVEAWVELASGTSWLTTQHYAPDVLYPRGLDHLVLFAYDPWPRWTFRLPDGTTIVHEAVVAAHGGGTVLTWRCTGGSGSARLNVRPLLSGRDHHALMRENAAFDFTARTRGRAITWRPYAALPAVTALASGEYRHDPVWYRNFLYAAEAERGLDCTEDLGAPGVFAFDLRAGDAAVVLRAGEASAADAGGDPAALAARLRAAEYARRDPHDALARAADAFVVRRGSGATIVAGYPWFTDWGRDTFIAMRGLLLARHRFDVAAAILLQWAAAVSEGMLPNRFPDIGADPEYNSVDASLWFVVAAQEFMAQGTPTATARATLVRAIDAILDGYTRGTRYGIRADADGLLACGVPGVQLTWMDARVDGRVITPRIGKPVEVQALWINALRLAGRHAAADRAQAAFVARFVVPAGGLCDVVDADHVAGRIDASIRPNQILAVGGLPHAIVPDDVAANVVAIVCRELVTPLGLRTLARGDPAYRPRYEGGVSARDGAYHQGTVWPWLLGPFVEAWLRVNGDGAAQRGLARSRFVAPLEAQLATCGLGFLPEIADGDPPHTPRGCPFQAWSLGELLRMRKMVDGVRA